jgi:ABC-2 type transport system permease protein
MWINVRASGGYPRLVVAGFRRYATYRQAMFAGLATNVVFGLIRVAVLTAAFRAAGDATGIGGYDIAATTTYVWLGQGLLSFVLLWGDTRLAERIRSGDVVVDLHRPWNLQVALLADDLGRAGYAALTRLLPPVVFGAAFFPFRWPTSPAIWPLFLGSAVLAVVVSFGLRFLLNVSTFWLLDNRGAISVYGVISGVLCGLSVPLAFFPDWARATLWCTPFPAMLQTPIDVFLQHGPLWMVLGHQISWVVLLFVLGRATLRRAVRKVVIQGG